MRCLILLLLGSIGLIAAEPEKPTSLRYLRPAKAGLVLESEITHTPSAEGFTYVSRTDRGTEKMTLTLRYDKKNQLIAAEALQEKDKEKKSALLTLDGEKGQLKRGDSTDSFKAPTNPIVTTAPDWTDIFEVARRYDAKKGGKQEFAGLWIHPVQPMLHLTFTIEPLSKDTIKVKDQERTLQRYKIRLRSGDYQVWADESGRVYKLFPAGKPAAFVVLEGYEEATKSLEAKP